MIEVAGAMHEAQWRRGCRTRTWLELRLYIRDLPNDITKHSIFQHGRVQDEGYHRSICNEAQRTSNCRQIDEVRPACACSRNHPIFDPTLPSTAGGIARALPTNIMRAGRDVISNPLTMVVMLSGR